MACTVKWAVRWSSRDRQGETQDHTPLLCEITPLNLLWAVTHLIVARGSQQHVQVFRCHLVCGGGAFNDAHHIQRSLPLRLGKLFQSRLDMSTGDRRQETGDRRESSSSGHISVRQESIWDECSIVSDHSSRVQLYQWVMSKVEDYTKTSIIILSA